MIRLGVIGMGARAIGMTRLLLQADAEVRLAAVADPAEGDIRARLMAAGINAGGTTFFTDVDALLHRAAADLDGLLIGTRCHLHTPIAVRCAPAGLPIFLEKPVAISVEQVAALAGAFAGRDGNVVVSFPLRTSPLYDEALRIVASGRLGVVNQVQAWNYVPYGGIYFGQWYRDFDVTGGLWLQKATHDLDAVRALVGADPVRVAAVGSRRIYGGDRPPDLTCDACDRAETCPEGPTAIAARGDDGGMGRGNHACAFSSSIRHHDAGSAVVMHANGVIAGYAQNLVSRRNAGARGARVTGYLGTLEFNWYSEQLTVIDHHGREVESRKVTVTTGHHGGDHVLARNFIDVIRGVAAPRCTLRDGLVSAAVCAAAQRSEERGTFERVDLPRFPGACVNGSAVG